MACIFNEAHIIAETKYTLGGRKVESDEYEKAKYISKKLDEKADEILKVCSETFGFLFSMDRAVISPSSPMLNFPFHLIKDDKYLFEEVRVTFLPHADIAKP